MPTTNIKPTSEEIDQAKQIYKDVNDYLDYLVDVIQTNLQEYEDSEDSDDEEISPAVSQFLNDYKEYISSRPQIHDQLVNSSNSDSSSSSSSTRKRLWRYSQQLPPNLIGDLKKLYEAKLDRSVQASPLFSISLPTPDNINCNNEKLLTNETSPSITLLKAQQEKYVREEQEKNRIVIRVPKYSYDEPIEEERKVVFVVKKSTAVIVAPPTVVEPPKEQEPTKEENNSTIEDEKSEVVEISEKISEKYVKKSTIDFDFISKFLSITKVGFSKSQLSSLVWT